MDRDQLRKEVIKLKVLHHSIYRKMRINDLRNFLINHAMNSINPIEPNDSDGELEKIRKKKKK